MSGALSDYSEAIVDNAFYRNATFTGAATVYLALYTAAPTDSGGGTEAAWAGYARQAVTFSAASGSATANTNQLVFPAVAGSGQTIVAFGVFDSLSGGNLLIWKALGTSVTYNVTDVPQIEIGGVTPTLSGDGSTYKNNKILDILLRGQSYTGAGTTYMALFSVAPTVAGGGTEFADSSYERKGMAFGAPSAGASLNTGVVTYDAIADGSVDLVACATFDALTTGNMIDFKVLDDPITYAINDIPQFAIGGITVSAD
jgi:hypothetical protein